MKDIVLLYSGGYDSTLAAVLLNRENGTRIHALTVEYRGRPKRERETALKLARMLKFASHSHVELQLPNSVPLVPQRVNNSAASGKIAYRNLLFWSLGTHYAAQIDATGIAAGHTRRDASHYCDASRQFFMKFAELTRYSGSNRPHGPLQILLPLQSVDPLEYGKIAKQASSILNLSWSCWLDGNAPCGLCFACIERANYLESINQR